MKKNNLFIVCCLACIVLFFTNCSGSDDMLNVSSDIQNVNVKKLQQLDKANCSNANTKYHVTIEDA